MNSKTNQQIVDQLRNGDDGVLLYLSKSYFSTARKWLRRNGCRDKDTPQVFSKSLIRTIREVQLHSSVFEFEPFFFKTLSEECKAQKTYNSNEQLFLENDGYIAGSCFTILDEDSQKLIAARIVRKQTFEQIAVQQEYSNPVIADFEFNRAFSQYANIVRARLNMNKELQ